MKPQDTTTHRDNKWGRLNTWQASIIISLMIASLFLLLKTKCFTEWFTYEIPSVGVRTLSASLIVLSVSFIIVGTILFGTDIERDSSTQKIVDVNKYGL